MTITQATIAGSMQAGNFAPYTGTPGPVGPIGSLFLYQETTTANVPARQRLTFTSTVPIKSVEFVVNDHTRSNAYHDGLILTGFGSQSATSVDTRTGGVTIVGNGTSANPWTLSGVQTDNATSRTRVAAQSPTASVNTFTFEYINATNPAVVGGSAQYISLSDLQICF
ncbi:MULTISPECIES: hypothetical protein [unclassified Pseudoclavibacter]|uniref:hypothetical protein n=1 Tax=unclassified Pseudoclavibacter TaxID=2615177 RepID=UPI0011AFFD1C|nr:MULTISPECIES: hypothetical protein [unclassified Pseudoclavibacter]